MHLGNSIICPVTGIPMIIAMGVTAVWAYKKSKLNFTKEKFLPAVMLTAFVFALQMINFLIPTTGSSGHVIGAVLLSAILGPYVAFLSICSILVVQSLFFADGGISALGCNIFNMGFLACFIAYPFAKKIFKSDISALFFASILALQLGSIFVAVEGVISGSVTNFVMFLYLMCSIHLAIGIVEGFLTGVFVEIAKKMNLSTKFSYITGVLALMFAGLISNYASTKPDGLEWSLLKMSDKFVEQTQGQIYAISETIQAKTSILTLIPSVYANLLGLLLVTIFAYLMFRSCFRYDNPANQV